MVVENRLCWLLSQLQQGRASRTSVNSSKGKITVHFCLAPKEHEVCDNSFAEHLVAGILQNLGSFVATDHGHQKSNGSSEVCLSLRALGTISTLGRDSESLDSSRRQFVEATLLEPWELLRDMAITNDALEPVILLGNGAGDDIRDLSVDESLALANLRRREENRQEVLRVKRICCAADAVGMYGSLTSLREFGVITTGMLLESTEYSDVPLSGFGLRDFLTSGACVRVRDIQLNGIVLEDASPTPALNQYGSRVFGRPMRPEMVFPVVGHSLIGGQMISWSDG